jgi:hypothetical protein
MVSKRARCRASRTMPKGPAMASAIFRPHRNRAGAVYEHAPTGSVFICGGAAEVDDDPARLVLLPLPVLLGGKAEDGVPEEECRRLVPPPPPPRRPKPRVWKRTAVKDRPPGFFLVKAR